MVLLYIFAMTTSTNLFATLLLFSVSLQFELIQFNSDTVFPFALHVSTRLTLWHCFDMGWSQETGACATGLVTPPLSSAQDADNS